MAQKVRVTAVKPGDLSLTFKLSSDLHVCSLCVSTYILCTHKINA